MREDLGSISDIVEKGVEEAMLGRKTTLDAGTERQAIMRKDMGSEVKHKFQYEALMEELKESKEILGLNAQTFRNMVDQALCITKLIPKSSKCSLECIGSCFFTSRLMSRSGTVNNSVSV